MKFLQKKSRKVIINITYLIDVLFLLLILFMVSSTFIEQPGMKLELPESQSKATEKLKNLVLEITADEQLFLNGKQVSDDVLPDKLTELLPTLKEPTVILKADKMVPHGTVVRAMDIAKLAGFKKIVVATKVAQSR